MLTCWPVPTIIPEEFSCLRMSQVFLSEITQQKYNRTEANMLYVLMVFLCELSSCLISTVRVALLLCTRDSECAVGSVGFRLSAWHKIHSPSLSIGTAALSSSRARKENPRKVDLVFFKQT